MGKGRSQVVAAFGWGHSNTVITERSHGEKMGDSVVRTTRALEVARGSRARSRVRCRGHPYHRARASCTPA